MFSKKNMGIQQNALVLPSRIDFSTKKGDATYQEKGFSFVIPEDKQKMLKEIFIKGSRDSYYKDKEQKCK